MCSFTLHAVRRQYLTATSRPLLVILHEHRRWFWTPDAPESPWLYPPFTVGRPRLSSCVCGPVAVPNHHSLPGTPGLSTLPTPRTCANVCWSRSRSRRWRSVLAKRRDPFPAFLYTRFRVRSYPFPRPSADTRGPWCSPDPDRRTVRGARGRPSSPFPLFLLGLSQSQSQSQLQLPPGPSSHPISPPAGFFVRTEYSRCTTLLLERYCTLHTAAFLLAAHHTRRPDRPPTAAVSPATVPCSLLDPEAGSVSSCARVVCWSGSGTLVWSGVVRRLPVTSFFLPASPWTTTIQTQSPLSPSATGIFKPLNLSRGTALFHHLLRRATPMPFPALPRSSLLSSPALP